MISAKKRLVEAGAAGDDPADRRAKVGAVEVKADALAELIDRLLGEAGVGAGGAGLGAGIAFLDTSLQRVVRVPGCLGCVDIICSTCMSSPSLKVKIRPGVAQSANEPTYSGIPHCVGKAAPRTASRIAHAPGASQAKRAGPETGSLKRRVHT